jgi:SAM-dependent methyltransferase
VYHYLKSWRKAYRSTPLIADIGSGVTFFPFAVAQSRYDVVCADIDAECMKDVAAAVAHISARPGRVDSRLISDPSHLPFADREADIVYSISVLEHIAKPECAIGEIHRILKPGGVLILTVDLDRRGDSELSIQSFQKLRRMISGYFRFARPEMTVHPRDMLRSDQGPYAYERPRGLAWSAHIVKNYLIKPVLGRKPSRLRPYSLTVWGAVLKKR